MKHLHTAVLVVVSAAIVSFAFSTATDAHNPMRHRPYMMRGLVPPYLGKYNPLRPIAQNISAGGVMYSEHCQTCHGKLGYGDGEGGRELTPKPANIAFIMDRPVATDEFLFWTISEGGKPFNSDMPAYKDVLSEKERWQIILYMRAGFPAVKTEQD